MAMQVGSAGGEGTPMVEINTTPLIDVMLVLLIMLIITIPIQMHAVQLDMPQPNAEPPPLPPVVVNIEVAFDGAVTWNGTPVANTSQLDDFLRSAANEDPQPEIHLRPDPLAKWDVVAKVLAASQRIGVEKIGFAGNEQYQ
jgi:biopolymer transport protein ExbD